MVETPNGPGKPDQQKPRWHDSATIWSVIVATIVAAIAAGASAYQGYAANQALDISRKANEIAIRPYIKITFDPSNFDLTQVTRDPGRRFRIKFTIENTGKLPAMASVQSGAIWVGKGHPQLPHTPAPIRLVGRRFLFPGGEADGSPTFDAYTDQPTDGEIVDLKGGSSNTFLAIAWVGYGISNSFQTQVCNVYSLLIVNEHFQLGDEEPCPEPDSNYAK